MLGSRFDLAEALNTIAAARDAAVAAAEEDIALEQAASDAADEDGATEMDAPDLSLVAERIDLNELFTMGEQVVGHVEHDGSAAEISCGDLEREMIEVARSVHRLSRVSFKCPVCDSAMEICDEQLMSEFGALDVKLHRLECDNCGMLTGRAFHPSFGYHALVR